MPGQGRDSVLGRLLQGLALGLLLLGLCAPPAHGYLISPLDLPTMMKFKSLYVNSTVCPQLSTWNESADCSTWVRVQCDYNRVAKIDIQGCQFGGPMPYFITNLTGMRLIYFDSNGFTGSYPEELSKLKSLQLIRLTGNQLTGSLPDSFSVLKSLYKFHAAGNLNLVGSVPDSWSAFNLQEFYIDSNGFTGPVPPVICKWSGLQRLHIGGNAWSGGIPSCMSQNTQLIDMYMDNCGTLAGTLPDLGNVKSLQRIFLNGNNITGPIPPSYGTLSNLNVLFLSGNRITGPLPDTMAGLTALTAWVMEFNQIDGTIPQSIGSMTVVQRILLDNNRLTGTIPSTIGNLKSLTILLLEGNGLTGRIPPEIPAGCVKLNQFNVESNSLSGVPPGGFASTNLYQVNYRSNIFSGAPNFTYSTGAKFCPPYWPTSYIHSSVAFNCFSINTTGCPSNDLEVNKYQYSAATCLANCGANNPLGACAGRGYCTQDKTCVCDPGYVPANNKTTCVADVAAGTAVKASSSLFSSAAVDVTPEEKPFQSFFSSSVKSAQGETTCSLGASSTSCSLALSCLNAGGYGCSCAEGADLKTPYCTYTAACLDKAACPVLSTCSDNGGEVTCSCPSGFRPIKKIAQDSFFAYCAKTKCSNKEDFVGFRCEASDSPSR